MGRDGGGLCEIAALAIQGNPVFILAAALDQQVALPSVISYIPSGLYKSYHLDTPVLCLIKLSFGRGADSDVTLG